MTKNSEVTIEVTLPADEAMALAQMCKRFGYSDATNLSNSYDQGRERDAMLRGINAFTRSLADAGFAPR